MKCQKCEKCNSHVPIAKIYFHILFFVSVETAKIFNCKLHHTPKAENVHI